MLGFFSLFLVYWSNHRVSRRRAVLQSKRGLQIPWGGFCHESGFKMRVTSGQAELKT